MSLKFKPLAKEVTQHEGGKVNLSIAQVSEVLRVTLGILATRPASEVLALVEQYKTNYLRKR